MADQDDTPRFLADAMLGRLARWLRTLGFDTLHAANDEADAAIVARADREARLLLTRDRHLLRELRPRAALEIRSGVPLEQLRQVVDARTLAPPRELFTRCLLCNTPLETLDGAEAMALVPESARGRGGPVRRCPSCARIYWRGSHTRRIERALTAALPAWWPGGR